MSLSAACPVPGASHKEAEGGSSPLGRWDGQAACKGGRVLLLSWGSAAWPAVAGAW